MKEKNILDLFIGKMQGSQIVKIQVKADKILLFSHQYRARAYWSKLVDDDDDSRFFPTHVINHASDMNNKKQKGEKLFFFHSNESMKT